MNSTIDYDHSRNIHTLTGAKVGLAKIREEQAWGSLLDVGSGTGAWLKAAMDLGIDDFIGLDGIDYGGRNKEVPSNKVVIHDLREPIDLKRKFDVVLCLEVAEHLPESCARTIVETVCRHGDIAYFSAAAPGQAGDHHVNCQWPTYWQDLFNDNGFVCNDGVRFKIWEVDEIEPWYRQNIFMAQRDAKRAGNESRILPVVHPDMMNFMRADHVLRRAPMWKRIAKGAIGRAKRAFT